MTTDRPDKKERSFATTLPDLPIGRRPSESMVRRPEPGRSETVVLQKPAKRKPKAKSIDRR